MAHVYQEIPSYKDLKITKITEGSVVVEHLVLLHVSIDEYNNVVKSVSEKLSKTICTIDSRNGDELCFSPNRIVLPVAIDPKEICSNQTEIPENIQPYYSPLNVSGMTICVSRCSSHSENPLDCNRGHCSVTNRGPQCYCEESSEFWYTGDHCQMAISKAGVYAGVTIGLFVLLVIITALAIISYRRQKESDKTILIDYKRWNEDQWEKDDNSANGSNSNFCPNLGTVDTNLTFTIPRPTIVSNFLK
ncbi:mucin-3A-like [Dendrobates tinctorius]|uniref:mucin-3A-like n=1 Tax=Dendrobates tinctorius TaxID=92724 RepID=UPI003CCA18DA